MKVLMLNGSWNQDGSTKAGLDEMAKVFAAEGVETEVVTIGGKPIADCMACGKCAELKRCVFADDGVNAFAEIFGDTAKVLPPKAFSGSSIKSNVKALEDFADERIAGK